MIKRICVLGLGYIGFPTALLFAKEKFHTIGVDINKDIVNNLNLGKLHFDEPELSELFIEVSKNFTASTNLTNADVFIIAVPTPLKPSLRVSNLSFVRSACEMIVPYLKKGNLVILESTVTPGASEKVAIPILEKSGLKVGEFLYVHCPERAIPGNTIFEMIHNDRIIGGYDQRSLDLAKTLYSSFVKGSIISTDIKTAEFAKLIENTYRDVNIALANELAQIAEDAGINCWEAISLANRHPRVNILNPGPGVGGHCIAVDPWFLTENSSKLGIIQISRDINDAMPSHVLKIVRNILNEVKEPVITIFGIAYKGNVDDTRETPALKFIKLAENEGYIVKCYDPLVIDFEYPLLDLDQSVSGSDCIVIIADHSSFKNIIPSSLIMRNRNVVDTRNIINPVEWHSAGFNIKFLGIGKNYNEQY